MRANLMLGGILRQQFSFFSLRREAQDGVTADIRRWHQVGRITPGLATAEFSTPDVMAMLAWLDKDRLLMP